MNDIYLPGSYIQETQQFMGWDCLFLHSVVWLRVRISSCNLNMITDQSNYICTEIMLTTGLIHYIENNFFCIYLLLQLIFFFSVADCRLGFLQTAVYFCTYWREIFGNLWISEKLSLCCEYYEYIWVLWPYSLLSKGLSHFTALKWACSVQWNVLVNIKYICQICMFLSMWLMIFFHSDWTLKAHFYENWV